MTVFEAHNSGVALLREQFKKEKIFERGGAHGRTHARTHGIHLMLGDESR
jgi:hypothetical protein